MQPELFDNTPAAGKSIIYRSSAGSGKTFTLTKSYLKLVLLDPSCHQHILAITFTNKAKEEMKTRIVDELTNLANGENTAMRQEILKEFRDDGYEKIEDVVTPRAKKVLDAILHDYSRFQVSTIDHFFTQLIRNLARELKLNLGYELDVDNKKALSESINMLFEQADKGLLKWLNDFALNQIENDKGWDIRRNISDLGKKLFQESYLDIESALRQNIPGLGDFIKEQKEITARYKNEAKKLALVGQQAQRDSQLQDADFSYGASGPIGPISKLAHDRFDWKKGLGSRFVNANEPEKWFTQKSDKKDEIVAAYHAGLGEAQKKLVALFESERYIKFLEAEAVLTYIHSYGVLATLAQRLQDYRNEHNLLLISDTAFILNEAIGASDTPFIYEKIGARYKYILIDEFQDTSRYQWKSLLPFFRNAIDNGGQLYIVGDVKQSIYGWRGGDLNLLLTEVEKDMGDYRVDIRKLNTNRRSARNIIEFNNCFFKVAAEILPTLIDLESRAGHFLKAYEDVEQVVYHKYAGLVKVQFFGPNDASDAVSWKDLANDQTITEIQSALTDGFKLNDILILTRKTNEASGMAAFLLENGIPAISEAALRITHSSKVQLVLSALRYQLDNHNLITIAEFNHFYHSVHGNSLVNQLTETPALLKATNSFSRETLYSLVEEILIYLGLNNQADIYLQKLLDICLAQQRKGRTSVAAFLEWWDEQEDAGSDEFSLSPPEKEDAITVLTIHKAKGLEKPIVFVPYADFEFRPKSGPYWAKPLPETIEKWGSLPVGFSKYLQKTGFAESYSTEYMNTALEALNLLYVAFTRAGERLIIFANAAGQTAMSAKLIEGVLLHDSFPFKSHYKEKDRLFLLGAPGPMLSKRKEDEIGTMVINPPSSKPAEKLVVDQSRAEFFMNIHSEKSEKIKEGLALHLALSRIHTPDDIEEVLNGLVHEKIIRVNILKNIRVKIESLFKKIPTLKDWFSGDYRVLNERPILAGGEVHIPDRVMINGRKAIVVDYKREVPTEKYRNQVKRYAHLLTEMGYDEVEGYLLYIDEPELEKVL